MTTMRLRELCQDLEAARFVGDSSVEVARVRSDSREVEAGDLFVATRGLTVDGHDFIPQALGGGAAALVVERDLSTNVPQVVVPSTAAALGWLAARAAGRPTDAMMTVAITGTNGKTTTTYLIEQVLAAAAKSPGVIGTVSYRFAGQTREAPYTTPVPEVLHAVAAEMRDAGVTHLIMEASSVALEMERLAGMRVQVAAFTNFTQDHLDVHGTMDDYFEAKARLFARHLAPDGAAVALVDDGEGRGEELLRRAPPSARRLRVSLTDPSADVYVATRAASIAGIRCTIRTPRGKLDVWSPALLGEHNIANVAVCVGVAEALGVEHAAIAQALRTLPGVPGRLERVANDVGLDVFVDYAHTPDALERVIAALSPLARGRTIVVFGCGGDRDRQKRPLMGRVVAQAVDVAIITSDNPRTEDPDSIIHMIHEGVAEYEAKPPIIEPDRRRAIARAIELARAGDVLLIAGKGHEDYQIIGKTKHHFDDREEAARAMAELAGDGLRFTLEDIVEATGGRIAARHADTFRGVTIDSRAVKPGDVYFAIKGERFDGHDFGDAAVQAGASAVVVAAGRAPAAEVTTVEVPDPRQALGEVAHLVRMRSAARIVGITGSSGKTTTKALVGSMLREVAGEAGVAAAAGSLNNETGVPLSLLELRARHRFAIIELGMRRVGDIEYLARFVEPDVAVVVNAQVAHLGVVGSVDDIARGKGEIFRHVAPDGFVVYPRADDRLVKHALAAQPDRARHVTFGVDPEADVRITHVRARGAEGSDIDVAVVRHGLLVREVTCHVPLVGRHNAENAACAIAVAVALGLDLDVAVRGIGRARPAENRSEVRELGGRHLLADYYNANPSSMRAAIATLADVAAGQRRFAVLGDMLELGETEEAEHEKLGAELRTARADGVIALGKLGPVIARAARAAGIPRVESTEDPQAAAALLLDWSRPADWILVKASRGVQLERVVEAFTKLLGSLDTDTDSAPPGGRT